jgi:phage tail sheath protein FI
MPRLDYHAPGVYVEEVDRGSRPIEGVGTAIAGFVGFTEAVRGDAKPFEPMLVTTWTQYQEYFAAENSDGYTDFDAYLPFAVRGFFMNGGASVGYSALAPNSLATMASPKILLALQPWKLQVEVTVPVSNSTCEAVRNPYKLTWFVAPPEPCPPLRKGLKHRPNPAIRESISPSVFVGTIRCWKPLKT